LGWLLARGGAPGRAGAAFRSIVDWLVGVDLSPAMVAQAAIKGLYDRLATADLQRFLAEEAASAARYHLVLAADVFVYVNDLRPIMAAIARVLAPGGGVVAFTVETHSGSGAKLLPTLRYAHGAAHVRGAVKNAGLSLAHLAEAAVRTEKGVPVDSLIVVARPSTAMPAPVTSGG
jgi:predicted TPR repeat methyltransferase